MWWLIALLFIGALLSSCYYVWLIYTGRIEPFFDARRLPPSLRPPEVVVWGDREVRFVGINKPLLEDFARRWAAERPYLGEGKTKLSYKSGNGKIFTLFVTYKNEVKFE